MFDIGFSELFVIAIVALIVLGPERLPKAARFTGLWVRRARAQWYSVKSELENELADDELKRSLQDTRDQLQGQMRHARDRLRQEADALQGSLAMRPPPVASSSDPPPASPQSTASPVDPVASLPASLTASDNSTRTQDGHERR